jgi:glycosyltransferase involved in cell wall biosynthesis
LLFTARGSDEGHRAILEAMACGVPPATFPLEGVHALLGPLSSACVAPAATPEVLAATALALLQRDARPLRRAAYERSLEFSYARAAERLLAAY